MKNLKTILFVKKYLEIDDTISTHKEKIKSLNDDKKEYEDKLKELEDIKNTTIQQMWIKELVNLEKFL